MTDTINGYADDFARKMQNNIFGLGTPSDRWDYQGVTFYIALFNDTPLSDGSAALEPSAATYNRILLDPVNDFFESAISIQTGTNRIQIINAQDIEFNDTLTDNWGTITGFGIYDSLTAGTLLLGGELTAQKPVGPGTQPRFKAGDLIFVSVNAGG